MRNSSSLDWLRFMHTPNDYRVSPEHEEYGKINGILPHLCTDDKQIQCTDNINF